MPLDVVCCSCPSFSLTGIFNGCCNRKNNGKKKRLFVRRQTSNELVLAIKKIDKAKHNVNELLSAPAQWCVTFSAEKKILIVDVDSSHLFYVDPVIKGETSDALLGYIPNELYRMFSELIDAVKTKKTACGCAVDATSDGKLTSYIVYAFPVTDKVTDGGKVMAIKLLKTVSSSVASYDSLIEDF